MPISTDDLGPLTRRAIETALNAISVARDQGETLPDWLDEIETKLIEGLEEHAPAPEPSTFDEPKACEDGRCSFSFGEGTREDPDVCVHCGAMFERDATTPFAFRKEA